MSEETIAEAPDLIESEAMYAAKNVLKNIKQRGAEADQQTALNTLAVLDAEHNYTSNFSGDELDDFLDEFENAVKEEANKQKEKEGEIEKRADGEADDETE